MSKNSATTQQIPQDGVDESERSNNDSSHDYTRNIKKLAAQMEDFNKLLPSQRLFKPPMRSKIRKSLVQNYFMKNDALVSSTPMPSKGLRDFGSNESLKLSPIIIEQNKEGSKVENGFDDVICISDNTPNDHREHKNKKEENKATSTITYEQCTRSKRKAPLLENRAAEESRSCSAKVSENKSKFLDKTNQSQNVRPLSVVLHKVHGKIEEIGNSLSVKSSESSHEDTDKLPRKIKHRSQGESEEAGILKAIEENFSICHSFEKDSALDSADCAEKLCDSSMMEENQVGKSLNKGAQSLLTDQKLISTGTSARTVDYSNVSVRRKANKTDSTNILTNTVNDGNQYGQINESVNKVSVSPKNGKVSSVSSMNHAAQKVSDSNESRVVRRQMIKNNCENVSHEDNTKGQFIKVKHKARKKTKKSRPNAVKMETKEHKPASVAENYEQPKLFMKNSLRKRNVKDKIVLNSKIKSKTLNSQNDLVIDGIVAEQPTNKFTEPLSKSCEKQSQPTSILNEQCPNKKTTNILETTQNIPSTEENHTFIDNIVTTNNCSVTTGISVQERNKTVKAQEVQTSVQDEKVFNNTVKTQSIQTSLESGKDLPTLQNHQDLLTLLNTNEFRKTIKFIHMCLANHSVQTGDYLTSDEKETEGKNTETADGNMSTSSNEDQIEQDAQYKKQTKTHISYNNVEKVDKSTNSHVLLSDQQVQVNKTHHLKNANINQPDTESDCNKVFDKNNCSSNVTSSECSSLNDYMTSGGVNTQKDNYKNHRLFESLKDSIYVPDFLHTEGDITIDNENTGRWRFSQANTPMNTGNSLVLPTFLKRHCTTGMRKSLLLERFSSERKRTNSCRSARSLKPRSTKKVSFTTSKKNTHHITLSDLKQPSTLKHSRIKKTFEVTEKENAVKQFRPTVLFPQNDGDDSQSTAGSEGKLGSKTVPDEPLDESVRFEDNGKSDSNLKTVQNTPPFLSSPKKSVNVYTRTSKKHVIAPKTTLTNVSSPKNTKITALNHESSQSMIMTSTIGSLANLQAKDTRNKESSIENISNSQIIVNANENGSAPRSAEKCIDNAANEMPDKTKATKKVKKHLEVDHNFTEELVQRPKRNRRPPVVKTEQLRVGMQLGHSQLEAHNTNTTINKRKVENCRVLSENVTKPSGRTKKSTTKLRERRKKMVSESVDKSLKENLAQEETTDISEINILRVKNKTKRIPETNTTGQVDNNVSECISEVPNVPEDAVLENVNEAISNSVSTTQSKPDKSKDFQSMPIQKPQNTAQTDIQPHLPLTRSRTRRQIVTPQVLSAEKNNEISQPAKSKGKSRKTKVIAPLSKSCSEPNENDNAIYPRTPNVKELVSDNITNGILTNDVMTEDGVPDGKREDNIFPISMLVESLQNITENHMERKKDTEKSSTRRKGGKSRKRKVQCPENQNHPDNYDYSNDIAQTTVPLVENMTTHIGTTEYLPYSTTTNEILTSDMTSEGFLQNIVENKTDDKDSGSYSMLASTRKRNVTVDGKVTKKNIRTSRRSTRRALSIIAGNGANSVNVDNQYMKVQFNNTTMRLKMKCSPLNDLHEDGGIYISQSFQHPSRVCSTGYMKIPAGQTSYASACTSFMEFVVVEGEAALKICVEGKELSVVLRIKESIIIPPESQYSVINVKKSEDLILHYVRIHRS